ncbi:protein FAM166C B-like [Hydractinia symbiolongicarpus]|uniref:protein FAM166C B-like n=1 Tax=Hydractinia symbiolongicarpus TaxID=13093 RepID=UPI00254D3748|nr:protein FAM166C B-like [Hydractinia symbiolongicarpus]
MSTASQDWITTHAYTYRTSDIPPGYTGYMPQQRFSYGDTYGNTTAAHFQARRNHVLLSGAMQTAKESEPSLVKFPTVYSNDPSLVLAERKRSRERWMAALRYELSEKEMENFLKVNLSNE